MTCAEWEMRIASEEEDTAPHIAACESCRQFAVDLALNQVAMRDEGGIDPAALHSRVLSGVRKPRWIYAAAAGFVLAMLAYSLFTTREQAVEEIAFHFPAPSAPEVAVSANVPAIPPRRAPVQRAEVIKIVTDDPDVIILLVDSTGGV